MLHGWRVEPRISSPDQRSSSHDQRPDLKDFHRQQVDLYIPAGESGYWLGALRDCTEAGYEPIRQAAQTEQPIQVDLLYGDHEGGQRTIARFIMSSWPEENTSGRRAYAIRYWNVDRDDPR